MKLLTRSIAVISVNVGKPQIIKYKEKEITTGICKNSTNQALFLSSVNLDGDEQADLIHHGGKDKAVCVYSYEHYPFWENELDCSLQPGAFGENVTVSGFVEEDVCIGDVFQFGQAIVQISQPRQPCHKLAKKYNHVELPVRVQDTGYTGFYFRVLEEGWILEERSLERIKRHPSEITIAYANRIMYHDQQNIDAMKRIMQVEELSESWRKIFHKRIGRQE